MHKAFTNYIIQTGDIMRKRILVIADDLTGANDTGAQFAKQGLSTLVVMNPDQLAAVTGCDVIVIDTDSRALQPEKAYERTAEAAKAAQKCGFGMLYKKVDSTLRGNVGTEIDAIMDECGCPLAIVAPAFPKNGRTTIGGYHLLKGVPLEATEISRDPKCPVRETNLVTLLSGQTSKKLGHLAIKTMLQGQEAIASAIAQMREEGVRIIVCDIWQDDQFPLLAEAAASVEKQILWVGSAGLAEALPGLLQIQPQQTAGIKPVLIVAGSVSSVTRRQIERLAAQPNTFLIRTESDRFLDADGVNAYVEECHRQAQAALAKGHDVIVASGYDENIVAKTKEQGSILGFEPARTSDIVAAGLGKIVGAVIDTHSDLCGMVFTGGDTAINICHSLSAYGLKVISEVTVGIPLGLLQGGRCHNMPVVTKAGAFGDEDALQKAVQALKGYDTTK